MNSRKYKVALIGCGWVGLGVQLDEMRPRPASHTEAVLADPKTELCAFFDNQQESLDLAEKLYPEYHEDSQPIYSFFF
mgnify:CR=1 FL=1